MSMTQKYRNDHEEFITQVKAIEALMGSNATIQDKAKEIVSLLAKFSGALKLHLAVEDNNLYPRLLKDPNPKIQQVATKFQNEMGDLKSVFDAYSKKWLSSATIVAQTDAFKTETTQLFKALANRIHRENTELYAVADQVG